MFALSSQLDVCLIRYRSSPQTSVAWSCDLHHFDHALIKEFALRPRSAQIVYFE